VAYGDVSAWVQAGDPDHSKIIDRVERTTTDGSGEMPPGGPRLSSDEINLIRIWIAQGAQNN
jgi:mono/diheme cytochrome c family protein